MREAKEGSAWLKDTDEDTFARVVEFLYTGDYRAAEHTLVDDDNGSKMQQNEVVKVDETESAASVAQQPPAPPMGDEPAGTFEITVPSFPIPEPVTEAVTEPTTAELILPYPNPIPDIDPDFWGDWGVTRQNQPREGYGPWSTNRKKAWHNFSSLASRHADRTLARANTNLRCNTSPSEDYTKVLLSHAKLYVFADAYDIEQLRSLALAKSHVALANFNYLEQRVGDVAALVVYVFENTPDREGWIDRLRSVVVEYVACNITLFMKDENVRALMNERNTFALNVLDMLCGKVD